MFNLKTETERTEGKLRTALAALDVAERRLIEYDYAASGKELAAQESDPRQRVILDGFGDTPPGDRLEDLQADADRKALAVARLMRRLHCLEQWEPAS